MESFKKSEGNLQEVLRSELSALTSERDELVKRIHESGENIDAELGSEAYIDHGYTVRLREIESRIVEIEAELADMDDVSALQRNLNI